MIFSSYDVNSDNISSWSIRLSNLQTHQLIAKAVMVYKSLHGLTPEYLISKFVSRDLPYLHIMEPPSGADFP